MLRVAGFPSCIRIWSRTCTHSMVSLGKPDFDPSSSSEQDISETSTLPGTLDSDVVRVPFISRIYQGPMSTRARMSLYRPRYAAHPPTICVCPRIMGQSRDSISLMFLFHRHHSSYLTPSLGSRTLTFIPRRELSLPMYG